MHDRRPLIVLGIACLLCTTSTATAQHMYWLDSGNGRIQRACLNGLDVQEIVVGLDFLRAIDLDVIGAKIYWTERSVYRSNLDGTSAEAVVQHANVFFAGIAVDLFSGKVYWTETGANRILRADVDGYNVEVLVVGEPGFLSGIALDPTGGKMYWTEREGQKIQRANLDGSNIEELVTTGVRDPRGIALDLDAGKMYWTDVILPNGLIRRANLDGSGVEDLVADAANLLNPRGIALDVGAGKMYWADSGADGIRRANLDGTNVEYIVAADINAPWDIALDLTPCGGPDCQPNGVPDQCDLCDGTSFDCNGNDVPDECDLAAGTSQDCNFTSIPDECEDDCNDNGIDDSCDISDGTSVDCNSNGVPDECEPDCNGNDVADECDIATGTSQDCNLTSIPDECEDDCNENGLDDSCDISDGTSTDVNLNALPDECEDCNENSLPDECDRHCESADGACNVEGCGLSLDCNRNWILDECDLVDGTSQDCNTNDYPDECERDCNANGLADECDVSSGTSADCNDDGIPDECETDCNSNGIADECDLAAGITLPCGVIEFVPTGSTGSYVIDGHELIIPGGGVQVEFEILLSGWGNAPGSRLLGAYNAVFQGRNLEGVMAMPFNRGVDLELPDDLECVSAEECPPLWPPPVTQTGDCGRFFSGWCDDSLPGFFLMRVCSDDLKTPCWNDNHCPNEVSCVDNSRFVYGSEFDPYVVLWPTSDNDIKWSALPWINSEEPGKADPDGMTKFLGATLRIIVPEDASGKYPIRLTPGRDFTFMNAPNILPIPSTIINGLLTIGGSCCMEDGSCEMLIESDCEETGGTFVGPPCGGDIDDDGVVDGCDLCPIDNPDDSDHDGVCDSDDVCPGFDDSLDNDGDTVPNGCDVCASFDDRVDGDHDGTPDGCDRCPGFPDYTDRDGDLTPDDCDGCPDDANKTEPGVCGCGRLDDGDSDNDGILDCLDQCPGVDDASFAPDCVDAIPTVSQWGLVAMTLLLLTAAKLRFRKRSSPHA